MHRKSRFQWIASELVGVIAVIAIGGFIAMRHYGALVFAVAISSAVVAMVIGLVVRR